MYLSFTHGDVMSATDPYRNALDEDRLLEQNPDLDREQIQEVREFVQQRRREGHGKTYEIDSPYERGPIVASESAHHPSN